MSVCVGGGGYTYLYSEGDDGGAQGQQPEIDDAAEQVVRDVQIGKLGGEIPRGGGGEMSGKSRGGG